MISPSGEFMTNKEMALEFLKLAATGDVKSAYARFVHPDFIHHNQYFKGDRQSLLTAMEESNRTQPNKKIETKQVFQEGNTVITHSLVVREGNEKNIAVVHIFRFQGDKVIELWDLGVMLQPDSPNENGAF